MQESTIPGPEGGPLGIDVLRAFRSDPLRYFAAQRSAHGDLVRLPFGAGAVHLIAHPDLVREALLTQGDRLVKSWPRPRSPSTSRSGSRRRTTSSADAPAR